MDLHKTLLHFLLDADVPVRISDVTTDEVVAYMDRQHPDIMRPVGSPEREANILEIDLTVSTYEFTGPVHAATVEALLVRRFGVGPIPISITGGVSPVLIFCEESVLHALAVIREDGEPGMATSLCVFDRSGYTDV